MKLLAKNIIRIILTLCSLYSISLNCIAQNRNESIKFIKHGKSFGFCSGYCFHETKFDSSSVISISKSWRKGRPDNNPVNIDTLKMEKHRWDSLVTSINIEKFKMLRSVIGCPGCDDGGEEWIEIGTKDKIYKVTFEDGEHIEGLNDLLYLVREKK